MTAKQAMTWRQSLETEKIQVLEIIAPFIQALESSIQPPVSLTPEGISNWNESGKSLWFELLESDLQEAKPFFAAFTETDFLANEDREKFLLEAISTLSTEDSELLGEIIKASGFDFSTITLFFLAIRTNQICFAMHNTFASSLMAAAKEGDIESLLKLIEADKIFLVWPLTQEMIKIKALEQDDDFLKSLGRAVSKSPSYGKKHRFPLHMLLLLFWALGIHRQLTYAQMLDCINEMELLGGHSGIDDPLTLQRLAHRIGLKKNIDISM